MKIYRIETENGIGPFHQKLSVFDYIDNDLMTDAMNKFYDIESVHCAPDSSMIGDGIVFGCVSVEHLKQWINASMINILKRYNYRISVYNIKSVIKSINPNNKYQIAFKVKNAKLIDTIILDHLI